MTNNSATRHVYEIKVQGRLDASWSASFEGMALTAGRDPHDGTPVTALTGPLPDQAALRGILAQLWDLNLVLISVRRLAGDERERK